MARRYPALELGGLGEDGSPRRGDNCTTPKKPTFVMDLPSPRVGEVPPALSPLDAFALHSRALARRLEDSAKAGRRLSRLPYDDVQSELAKRPGYFRATSTESDAHSSDHADDDDDDGDMMGFFKTAPERDRPKSQHPHLGHVETDRFSRPPTATGPAPQMTHGKEKDDHGYFGIQVPRSSSPEALDAPPSKPPAASPNLPSLTSSIDSIASSQPRTVTNEVTTSRGFQGGLAPPSPLPPRSGRSVASIRSVIDSGEEDNGSITGFERVRKSPNTAATGGASNPYSPMSSDYQPTARSPSAMSDASSVNEPLPRPSFNFSRPRSSSGARLFFEGLPSGPTLRNVSNGSSLKEAVSANPAYGDSLSTGETIALKRGPSRKGSGASSRRPKENSRFPHGPLSRENSSSALGNLSARAPPRQNSSEDSSRLCRGASPAPSGRNSPYRAPLQQGSPNIPHSAWRESQQQFGSPVPSITRIDTRSTTLSGAGTHSRQTSSVVDTASLKAPSRQASTSTTASNTMELASMQDPMSGDESVFTDPRDPLDPRQHNDPRDLSDGSDPRNKGVPSYIYSKYSLPRGRTVERNMAEQRNSWMSHQFKWEEPGTDTSSPQAKQAAAFSPSIGSRSPAMPVTSPNSPTDIHFPAGSTNRSRSAEPPGGEPRVSNHKSVPSTPSTTSASTDRTIRGRAHSRNSPSLDIAGLSPEEHLERGIQAHNAGSFSKSTYHLRLAARAGLPTAMLLYALACRHGWGMRANQAEGVQWLKRAVDSSSLDFMADNDPMSIATARQRDAPLTLEQKGRKAQFALAIYELGISYMNGWGIPRDKALALRCFEIAGSWGDNDALAEAGFCYTQGVGCKKDLKKAAAHYRRAAEGGMSMAGNSWYVDMLGPVSETLTDDQKQDLQAQIHGRSSSRQA